VTTTEFHRLNVKLYPLIHIAIDVNPVKYLSIMLENYLNSKCKYTSKVVYVLNTNSGIYSITFH
jgi:hypothetical protein